MSAWGVIAAEASGHLFIHLLLLNQKAGRTRIQILLRVLNKFILLNMLYQSLCMLLLNLELLFTFVLLFEKLRKYDPLLSFDSFWRLVSSILRLSPEDLAFTELTGLLILN